MGRRKIKDEDLKIEEYDWKKLENEFMWRMEIYRIKAGLTKEQFAHAIGYSLSGYKKMLSGKTRGIPLGRAICAILILRKLSLETVLWNDKMDPLALALDDTSFPYSVREAIFSFCQVCDSEFVLSPHFMEDAIDRVRKADVDFQKSGGFAKLRRKEDG